MLADLFNVSTDYLLGRTNVRNHPGTFAAHTDEDMSDEAKTELENFKDYLRNIYPENLPADEDIKKLERRVKSEEKKLLKETGKFSK